MLNQPDMLSDIEEISSTIQGIDYNSTVQGTHIGNVYLKPENDNIFSLWFIGFTR